MIGIISDIHGNLPALEAVINRLTSLGIHDIVCLGDIAGYYSQINECCDLLRERGVVSVMGNHDWYLAENELCPRSESANVCLDYQRSVITASNLAWLKNLPSEMTVGGVRFVHGGWKDPLDEYLSPTEAYFQGLEGRFFCSGHTHIPGVWPFREKTYCNPGSVGQPRDGNPKASFATWDGQRFEIHRVAYLVGRTQSQMALAGFDDYYFRNLSRGVAIGS
jgi:predicted phosphodiesterase